MKTRAIPSAVKADVERTVSSFNEATFPDPEAEHYTVRFAGPHAYLDRSGADFVVPCPVCRLTYTGDPAQWEFAIYKYSRARYDPEEWMFPGAGLVDGTVEGALKAGMKAYP